MTDWIVAICISLFIFPFILTVWFYGILLAKRMFQKLELKPKAGLEKAVQKWENLSAEERMESIRQIDEQKTQWLSSPKPEDEAKEMNERVFREGFVKSPPPAEFSDTDEE